MTASQIAFYADAFASVAGYRFKNPLLLIQALKHRSYLNVTSENRNQSYERLEFLGDAVLNLIVTEMLYTKFPGQDEGTMTKEKATLVNKKILADKASVMRLGEFILLSECEEKGGGRKRSSILSDVLEAVIGAVFLDSGYAECRKIALNQIYDDLDGILNDHQSVNFKGTLLELAQGKNLGMPVYSVINEKGPEHRKEFTVQVSVGNTTYGTGKGWSKKEAEQIAAREALIKLNTLKL